MDHESAIINILLFFLILAHKVCFAQTGQIPLRRIHKTFTPFHFYATS